MLYYEETDVSEGNDVQVHQKSVIFVTIGIS